MKILHCADIHLDSSLSTNLDAEKSRMRRAELVVSFKNMVDYAVANKIDAVIIAGDLFDSGVISKSTVSVVRQCVESNPKIDFYYLNGNHDEQYMMKDVEELKNFNTFGKDWISYDADESASVVITGIATETTYGIADNLSLDQKKTNIVVMHGQIYENCKEEGISLNALRNKGIDYLALGHIHRYMCEQLDARGQYCYPGCLESRGFDECEEHGFAVLDIDGSHIEKKFVPWGNRRAYHIDVDVTGCKDTLSCILNINNILTLRGVTENDMVEIVLVGEVAEDSEISADIISNELKNRYFAFKIKDKTRFKMDYTKYINDISLKGEFIKLVSEDSSLSEEEKTEIIRTGIMALAGETV